MLMQMNDRLTGGKMSDTAGVIAVFLSTLHNEDLRCEDCICCLRCFEVGVTCKDLATLNRDDSVMCSWPHINRSDLA